MASESISSTAPPERIIRPRRGWMALNLRELWQFRELFWFLAWRDVLVRYKQTYLGVAWAVLQPVLTMLIFTVLSRVANVPTNGAPAMVFILAGLLPWQLFSNALTESSNSLVASSRIISKVYFPRLIIPGSAVLSGALDFLIALAILEGLMIFQGVPVRAHLLLLPVFCALAFLAAFSAGVWLSALNVKYRDVRYIVPFFTRMGLYVSPIWFMPEQALKRLAGDGEGARHWLFLYHAVNPMAGVIEGFRWCILGPGFEPYWPGFWASIGVMLLLLFTGLMYFRRTERTFADVI